MCEQGRLRLGFVPLNDASALIAAEALGLFREEGVEVELVREASWATIRDKLAAGVIDGAHMLAPLALAMSLGVGSDALDLAVTFAMGWANAAVTIDADLAAHLPAGQEAAALKALVSARAREGSSRLTFATVFPFSTHEYLLRTWMERAGIDAGCDLRLTVVSPPRAADLLGQGVIEGFSSGEPWNSLAVARGAGRVVATAAEVLPGAPDKVFAATPMLAARRPEALAAITRALHRAAEWIGQAANRPALAELLSRPENLGVDAALVAASLERYPPGEGLHRPDIAQAAWLLTQMRRWGQIKGALPLEGAAARLYRPELYDRALAAL
jgi:NitT/TauT family transport system ATP-binding protein/nitrate/nitrite transport system substrate-binding protein